MRELDDILEVWRQDPSRQGVLATVVHVEGSAYRRPGARMLILPDGKRIGTISGGCLEGDVARKAAWWTSSGPVVRVYDTTSEDDVVWEFGLGCRGVIHVLLEPLSSPSVQQMLSFLDTHRRRREPVVAATLIRDTDGGTTPGERLLYAPGQSFEGALSGTGWQGRVANAVRAAFVDRKSRLLHLAGAEFFLEWVGPPQSLVIFGAGHDAIPLAAMANTFGWRVTVADGRPAYAKPSRFPGSCVAVLPPSGDIGAIDIDCDSAVVLMTHNYPLDRVLLPQILDRRPAYAGLLGPRHRAERLFADTGVMPGPELHYPAGLDIGGDSPEAIALAIASEIQAVTSGRAGGFLKQRQEPIHLPVEQVGVPGRVPYESTVTALCEAHV